MRLLELREEKNFTQTDVANAIKTSRTNIGRWEKGINEPTANYLIQLANLFECSIDYLLGRSDDFGNINIQQKSPAPTLTQAEQDLLNDFRSLPRPEQAQAAEYIHFLAQRRGTKKQNA